MIIKPSLMGRIFWGAAGATSVITGCSLSILTFPFGLVLMCLAFPLAFFSLAYAFGANYTRLDDEGVFQRNFLLMSTFLKWAEIERGEAATVSYQTKSASGWTENKSKAVITFVGSQARISIDSKQGTGPTEDWYADMLKIARERLGERYVVKK